MRQGEEISFLELVKYIKGNIAFNTSIIALKGRQNEVLSIIVYLNLIISFQIPVDMFKTIILSLLIVYATADNSVTIGCQMCQGRACLTLKGGPFQDIKIPSKEKSCSQVQVVLPVTYTFKCQSPCSDGCLMTLIQQQSRQSICTSNVISQMALNELDMLYNIQMRDPTLQSKYDWCGCPKSYTGWIILLLLVAVGVGAGAYFYLGKKKAGDKRRVLNEEAVVAMGDYHNQ